MRYVIEKTMKLKDLVPPNLGVIVVGAGFVEAGVVRS